MADIHTTPLLTAREAARCLKMPASTLDTWLAGGSGRALVHAVDPERRGWPRVPFVGLIEAYVLQVLRELNFTMPDIRRAADLVRREFDDPYALASQRIATDGVGLFVRFADEFLVHARETGKSPSRRLFRTTSPTSRGTRTVSRRNFGCLSTRRRPR
jgi:hypothetical protein